MDNAPQWNSQRAINTRPEPGQSWVIPTELNEVTLRDVVYPDGTPVKANGTFQVLDSDESVITLAKPEIENWIVCFDNEPITESTKLATPATFATIKREDIDAAIKSWNAGVK